MAMMLANAARLKSGIKLTQAPHDYEKTLSDRKDRSQVQSQGSPDATAAINLTTLVDRKKAAVGELNVYGSGADYVPWNQFSDSLR